MKQFEDNALLTFSVPQQQIDRYFQTDQCKRSSAFVLKLPATQKQKAITETTVDAKRFPM